MTAYDLLVAGGGVQGLWLARQACQAGLRVAVVDAGRIGAGASGGPLGALMPHMPTGWGEKKQFQFEALVELEGMVAELEAETGLDTGYQRGGRVMPVRTAGFRDQVAQRGAASRAHWQAAERVFEIELAAASEFAGWIDPDAAPLGVLWDPLAARIDPVRYMTALRVALEGCCSVREGWRFERYDAAAGVAHGTAGSAPETIRAGTVVLAAGYHTFDLVRAAGGHDLGAGVKGQAAILAAASLPSERPVIYDDGTYIVAHEPGRCAVGSTSEAEWVDTSATDHKIEARIAHARRICPPLRSAAVVATWAGVRPKCLARDPIVGQIAPDQPLYVATGGFKITLGIAHKIAACLIDAIVSGGAVDGLPETFAPDHHLQAAGSRSGTGKIP